MPTVDVTALPPKYQRQALDKLLKLQEDEQQKTARANAKAKRESIRFDSEEKAARFEQLYIMQETGRIRDLRLMMEFTLQPAYITPAGVRIRPIRYIADFTYWRRSGEEWEYVVEAVKGKSTMTKTYRMKKEMMDDRLGLTIEEV